MGRIRNWFFRKSASGGRPFEEIMSLINGGWASAGSSGVTVSAATALQVSTVLACVRVIADGCAAPELNIYRQKRGGSRELATNIPEFRLLNRRPNEWQTSIEFRRTMTMHAALTGNAFALKVKSGNRIRELIPIVPSNVQIEENQRYEVRYRVSDQFGHIGVFGPENIFHLPNWQWERVRGLDSVKLAREAIGLSIVAETSQGKLQANGGRPSGLLTTDLQLSAEAIGKLREAWKKFSSENRGGTAILDNGMKYTQLAMSAVDQQHLETRRFQVEEICRSFGVFPIMVGHADKTAAFASSEAFFAAHFRQTLYPWHQLWRQRLDEFVLDGDGPLFAEFDTRYMLAGDMAARSQWARTMAELGIYTRNELRDEEGKDPIAGLDEPLTPLNMTGGKPPVDPTSSPGV